jgi:hypothetical protein
MLRRILRFRRAVRLLNAGTPYVEVAARAGYSDQPHLHREVRELAGLPLADLNPRIGRPSTPTETYLRLMFLKFRYRLGYESLCREVSDSITWRVFCRIPLDVPVPHPTTLTEDRQRPRR